ncbi:hypothetical protein PDJAM_G00070110 [Pangasius djambal]|uniref:Uncharacterized protein n=1 Tax=Pangasius djambal TaxID=1691987 RepID=A0ACC5Z2H7_9TELE|nr:hypothetical protein [Pangasius djambal]
MLDMELPGRSHSQLHCAYERGISQTSKKHTFLFNNGEGDADQILLLIMDYGRRHSQLHCAYERGISQTSKKHTFLFNNGEGDADQILLLIMDYGRRSGRCDRMGYTEIKDHDYRDVDYRGYSHDGGYNDSDGLSKDRQHGRGDFDENRFRARGNREGGDGHRRGSGFTNSHAHFEQEERDFRFEDEHDAHDVRDYERYRRRSEEWRRDGGQAEEEKYSRSVGSRRVGIMGSVIVNNNY